MKTGVYEWADKSINIQIGCEHGCRYCYARHRAVERFSYCKSNIEWETPILNSSKVNKGYNKNYGTVMFPSTHDITPFNLSEYMTVLLKLLESGNNVLIVTKPHLNCISAICRRVLLHKNKVLFRFTIGSASNDVLKFWEPNAPDFDERKQCLIHAKRMGFKTSVSCEPYLDNNVMMTYELCRAYITDSFWIGKIRFLASRVNLKEVPREDIIKYVDPLKDAQSDSSVNNIYLKLRDDPLIKWKDSIKEVIGNEQEQPHNLP